MTRRGRLEAAGLAGIGVGIYVLLVRGGLTVDLGVGRSVRPLGPLSWQIAAPRELVFEVIAAPYLRHTHGRSNRSCASWSAARAWFSPSTTHRWGRS